MVVVVVFNLKDDTSALTGTIVMMHDKAQFGKHTEACQWRPHTLFTKLNAVHQFLFPTTHYPPPPPLYLISHLQKVMLMWSDQKVEYSETCINRRTPTGP